MKEQRSLLPVYAILCFVCAVAVAEKPTESFDFLDVFELERATDPRLSPDGTRIVYVRSYMDKMKDVARSSLWIIDIDGANHRPLTSGEGNDTAPRWSPNGDRIAYVSNVRGSAQLYLRWMDTGQTARLTSLTKTPSAISWSPDGHWLAFAQRVSGKAAIPLAQLPSPPKGAEWAKPPIQIERLNYRSDGAGYQEEAYTHLFVVPAVGGTSRQITSGNFNHRGTPAWSPDSAFLYISANRSEDPDFTPRNTEVYRVSVTGGQMMAMTDRDGPDNEVTVSPDGTMIAFVGFDDRRLGYQVNRLYVRKIDGSGLRQLTADLDRNVSRPTWSGDGQGLCFLYEDQGDTKLAHVDLNAKIQILAGNLGGASLGRPYSGGWYSLADNGAFVYTLSDAATPSDLVYGFQGKTKRITHLNQDLFGHKQLGEVEEFRYASAFDGRDMQGWIVKPPNFDPKKKYPLLLEIHGGPFSNYGPRFSAEIQLYAAAGYVVLYTNPRGSSSYGEAFGNLIHHNYPSQDYDDLISGVDVVISKGYVDPSRLFVTGGSGGGTLTAWIVGKTHRFRAAVSVKPVINWYSFVLTADLSAFFIQYWFPQKPWENPEHYMSRSPLSLVGNVTTPTMIMTGEADYRTPISESEQYYKALKLQKVDSALVRIPDASHGISARPSRLIAKVAYVLGWFARYDQVTSAETAH